MTRAPRILTHARNSFPFPPTFSPLPYDQVALTEWIANNYQSFGANLEFVTTRSQEGSQFCRGFGGIGGVLRWQVDFSQLDESNYVDGDDDDEGWDDYEGF